MTEGWATRGVAADKAREAGYPEFVTALLQVRRGDLEDKVHADDARFTNIAHHNNLPNDIT